MSVAEADGDPAIPDESDDEDLEERNAFNIEQAVSEFVDEPSIRHNLIPDSDSDEEDDESWTAKKKEAERDRVRRRSGNLYFGRVFFNGIAFKEAVIDYALQTGYNLKQYKYDKTRLGYCCVGDCEDGQCQWRIYCSTTQKSEKWQVKVFKDVHSCVRNGECEIIRVPVIARLFLDKIREEPDYFMPMKIEELVKTNWKIIVSRPHCEAARNKALNWIDREYDEQFSRLRDYGAEILESNPNSSVEIDCVTDEKGLDVFNRFYVCFDSLRRSWKLTCRPLIGVDGCFLRSKTKGQLLVALGRDPDNAIYPIAWGVVSVENTENWLWFMKKIKVDLDLEDGEGYILVSDRQKVSMISLIFCTSLL